MNLNHANMNLEYIPLSAGDSERTNSNTKVASTIGYYNRTKRKRENRASTYGLNQNQKNLIGQYGGCPWKRSSGSYDLGVVG